MFGHEQSNNYRGPGPNAGQVPQNVPGGQHGSMQMSMQNSLGAQNTHSTGPTDYSNQISSLSSLNNSVKSPSQALCTNQQVVQALDQVLAAEQYKFFQEQYQVYNSEKGNLYTWGSGEMGQLGYSSEVITKMPKDREGYPFQPYPLEIKQLRNKGIYQIAGGDGHTVAVDIKGNVYSWGASACGQLGLQSMKDLPTDVEGYPYQPTPRLIELLLNVRIVQIACGDAHTVALTSEGRLYSWGGGGCGQLGHPDTQCMPKDEDGCPYQPKPKMIQALKNQDVKEVSCGKAHTVAVLKSGHLYSWGAGACGQLGHPDTQTFPADEDGYPYQPIPRCVNALKQHKLIHASCGDVHTMVLTNLGEIYCFGGGSCGQLGFGNISAMPLDVDSCPFMPVPKKIDSLQNEFVVQLACGDSHSMALTKEGVIYAWGEATYGQLGLDDTKDLLKNTDQKPYQPFPTKVVALQNKKVIAISCGETHTLALTESGHLYSFGANGCGQLGQFLCEYEKKRRDSFEDIILPKISHMQGDQYSFMSGADSDRSAGENSSREEGLDIDTNKSINGDSQNAPMSGASPLMSPPPLYSTDDYKIDGMQLTPKLVKSLMHRKVIKISSGGVHNICIVEPQPSALLEDIYKQFMNGLYTDVVFTGFYQTYDASAAGANGQENQAQGNSNGYNAEGNGGIYNSQLSQHSYSDEDMRDGAGSSQDINLANSDIRINNDLQNNGQNQASNLTQMAGDSANQRSNNDGRRYSSDNKNLKKLDFFWKQKQRAKSQIEIQAHMGIIASKSGVLSQMLLENMKMQYVKTSKGGEHKKIIIDFKDQVHYQSFKKVIDFCYLDDLNVLNQVSDSNELIEIIKMSNQYKLARLLKAAEQFFQEHMVNWLDSNQTCLTLKIQPQMNSGVSKRRANQFNTNRSEESKEQTQNGTSNGRGQRTQQVSQGNNKKNTGQNTSNNQASGNPGQLPNQVTQSIRRPPKNQVVPQGLMFLPDGKALIMDNDLYRHTIENSIVIDLIDSHAVAAGGSEDNGNGMNQGQNYQIEETAVQYGNGNGSRNNKEVNRKPSQANQKRSRQGQDTSSLSSHHNEGVQGIASDIQAQGPNQNQNYLLSRGLSSISEESPGIPSAAINNIAAQDFNSDGQEAGSPAESRDFLCLLNKKEFSDVTLIVEGKQIFAHQVILASRSTYFEALFSHDFSEKDLRVVDFNDSGITYEQLLSLLRHIYSDNIKIESKSIYDLLSLADRYDIQSIKRKCENIFAQHISVDTVCQIFKYAHNFNCERLKETCLLYTEENHQEVITSVGFEELDRDEMLQIVRVGKEKKRAQHGGGGGNRKQGQHGQGRR